jgi:hypothetical protein
MSDVIRGFIDEYIAENKGTNPEKRIGKSAAPDFVFKKILSVRCAGHKGATIGQLLADVYVNPGGVDYDKNRLILENYGLKVTFDTNLAIAYNHPTLIHKLGRAHYHKIITNHDLAVTSGYVIRIGDKSRRAVIFKGARLEEYLRENA